MSAFTAIVVGNDTLTRACAEQMLDRGHAIAALVTRLPELRAWAEAQGVRVETPGTDLPARLEGLACDWLLSIANLDVLPAEVLALARRGAVNFHDGPLPRHAGLNAPVWALLAGEAHHGITWHMIAGGIDEGDILVTREIALAADETALSLNLKCYAAGVESFPALLDQLAGTPQRQPQDLSQRSYHGRTARPEAMGLLQFDRPADRVARMVRALDHGDYPNPLCIAKVRIAGEAFAVGRAQPVAGQGAPGEVLAVAEALTVACGQGAVRLAGLRRMDGSVPEITALAKPGDRLAPVAPEEVQALTGFAEALAPAEPFWRRAFAGFTPATLAGGGQGASGTEEIAFDWPEALDLQQKADLVRHWAAQASGMPDAGIALVHAGLETRGGLALPWVPFQRGDDIARLQARPAVPADLALRSPEIPALRLPDVAFALDVPSEAPLTVTAAGRLVFDRARISPAMGRILADRLAAMAEAVAGLAPRVPPAITPEMRLAGLEPFSIAA